MSAFSDLVFLAWPFLKFNDHFSAAISRAVRFTCIGHERLVFPTSGVHLKH